MMVLVSYDVSTVTKEGRARLRKVAKACMDYGQRVQNSVFECDVEPAQWAALRSRLERTVALKEDSLRYYFLGSNWRKRVEHVGAKPTLDLKGDSLIA